MDKPRRSWDEMAAVAGELVRQLTPVCTRVVVAGSLRRGRPQVADVELVAIPDGRALQDLTDEWLAGGVVAKRLKRNNTPIAWGARFRAMLYRGVPVDLFMTTPAQWGLITVLRTGPATPDVGFDRWPGGPNQMVVTPRAKGGLLPDALRVAEGWIWRGEQRLATPEEDDVFQLLGIPTLVPHRRDCAQYLRWKSAGPDGIARVRAETQHFALPRRHEWPAVGWGAHDPDVVFAPTGRGYLPYAMPALVRLAERLAAPAGKSYHVARRAVGA